MKNLLVDALRQASGVPTEDDPPPSPSAPLPPEDPPQTGPDARGNADLELAESTVLPESVRPAPSANHVFDERVDTDDRSIDDSVEDPTMLVEALVIDDPPAQPSPGQPAPVQQIARDAPRMDWILLFGRWSPLLCLLGLSGAAGSLAMYQRLSGQYLNVDLSAMPAPAAGEGDVVDEGQGWWALPENDAVDAAPRRPPATTTQETPRVDTPVANDTAVVTQTRVDPLHDPAHASVQAGFVAYTDGDLVVAERHYRDALAIAAQHRHALKGLAAVLHKTGRSDDAIPLYESLLTLDPKDTDAVAALLSHANDDDAAQSGSRLKLLLQRHPEVAALHFAMGLTMAASERWPEAHRAFLDAHARAPDNADYAYNVAVSAEHLARFDVARDYYGRALENAGEGSLIDRDSITVQLDLLAMTEGSPR